MVRFPAGALVPALLASFVGFATPALAGPGIAAGGVIQARTACDRGGRCYETGDPGYRDDDDVPPPPRGYDRDDRPPPHRYDPRDDDRPPPPRHRYDPDDDDRPPPPPPRRRDDLDDDDR